MADLPIEQGKRTESWVVAAVAVVALLCVTLLAMAVLSLPGRGSSSSVSPAASPASVINQYINTVAPAATPAGSATALPSVGAIERSKAVDTRVERSLPIEKLGALPSRAAPEGRGQTLPSPEKKIFLRVREPAPQLYGGKAALPMPVVRARMVDGAAVYASTQAPANPAPDLAYADGGARGADLELTIDNPRSTGHLQGYYAPEGFTFFTGKLSVRNLGAQPVMLDLGAFELRDAEGTPYLANPELSEFFQEGPLASGGVFRTTLSFLVSTAVPLQALVLSTPDASVSLPLHRR
jgi:hypothetical protein